MNTAGTPTSIVTPPLSSCSAALIGWNRAIVVVRAPARSGAARVTVRPKRWLNGRTARQWSAAVSCAASIVPRALASRLRWVRIAPSGVPAIAEV